MDCFAILNGVWDVSERRCSVSLQVKAALAAAELDEGEGQEFPAPGAALAKPPCSWDTSWPLEAIVQSWPLGLVLAAAPGSASGPRRALALLSCLRALQESSRGALGCGIASIRALPQVPPTLPPVCSTWSLGTRWDNISAALAICTVTNHLWGWERGTPWCWYQTVCAGTATAAANCARLSAEHCNLQSLSWFHFNSQHCHLLS